MRSLRMPVVSLAVLLLGCGDGGSSATETGSSGGGSAGSGGGGGAVAGSGGASPGGAGGAGGGGSGGSGGAVVPYQEPPCTKSFRDAPGASSADKLEAAVAEAAADRCFDPPAEDGPAAGKGPAQAQGVVRIAFDPSSPDYTGANRLIVDRPVALDSRLRLEIDAGILIVYNHYTDGALFKLSGLSDITITRGDPAHGEGVRAGRFVVDTSTDPLPAGSPDPMRARVIWLQDTERFLIEHFHTIQSWRTDSAAVVFNGGTEATSPRFGIYRHHSNEGSPQGYGPNQITSLYDSYIHDLWSEGGTTCRMETDGNHSGVHRVVADRLYGRNGNRVLVLMPYEKSSDTITISDVRGVSMFEGIHVGDQAGAGLFTGVTVTGGCIVAGPSAQAPVPTGEYPDPSPVQVSREAVHWGAAQGTDVTITAIGYSEEAASFLQGPGSAAHGVDGAVPCSAAIAEQGP